MQLGCSQSVLYNNILCNVYYKYDIIIHITSAWYTRYHFNNHIVIEIAGNRYIF